ncbi:MAG: AraC family transcriptional regulator [Eubacteriales bacterium]
MRIVDNHWDSLKYFNTCDIRACACGYVKTSCRSDWEYLNFTAPFDKLYFIESGELTAELLSPRGEVERVFRLTAGSVYIIPCGNVYNLYTDNGFSKYFLHFNLIMNDGCDLFCGVRSILKQPFDAARWQSVFSDGTDEMFSVMKAKSLAYESVVSILENEGAELLHDRLYSISHYPPEVLAAASYIRSALSARITVNDIAHECGISGQILSRQFKKHLGVSPKKYVSDKLWENAGELLLSTDMTVKEIACELKFNDQYTFSKFFKAHCGHSPSEYKKFRYSQDKR